MIDLAKRQRVSEHMASAAGTYLAKVYGLMFTGLLITAFVTLLCMQSLTVIEYLFSWSVLIPLMCVELGLAFVLGQYMPRLQASMATVLFVVFSVVNGLTLSPTCFMFTGASLFSTFLVTAGAFGAMSFYGFVTKRNLATMGSFLFMGLIGLILAIFVNIFLQSEIMHFVVSGVGVLVFTLFTAYDTQKILRFSEGAPQNDMDAVQRGAILGALSLYLDIINLFIYLLQFLGERR